MLSVANLDDLVPADVAAAQVADLPAEVVHEHPLLAKVVFEIPVIVFLVPLVPDGRRRPATFIMAVPDFKNGIAHDILSFFHSASGAWYRSSCLYMVDHLEGDCSAFLPTLPARSVHCVVPSPPYRGLRSYLLGDH